MCPGDRGRAASDDSCGGSLGTCADAGREIYEVDASFRDAAGVMLWHHPGHARL